MNEVVLARLCGYWYLFRKEAVQRVVPFAGAPARASRDGRVWLAGADAPEAELCPLHLLFPWATTREEADDHYLVLGHGGRFLALPMHGAGYDCMADVEAMRPLPPIFTGLSRRMIPALLVHGQQLLMRIDLAELFEAMDKIAFLRRKKQQQMQGQARTAGERRHAD